MKRIAALFLLIGLLCSSSTAEEAVSPTIPEFTAAYGLYEYYAGLQADWGPPHLWTLEQKAWLSGSMDTLLEMESARCHSADQVWTLTLTNEYPAFHQFQVTINDTTLEILDMTASNG